MTFNIQEQVNWEPEIKGGEVGDFDNVVVGGMGGSALPARALFYLDPTYPIWLHNDYGFPEKVAGEPLFVAISYSGNTTETLSFANEVLSKGRKLAVITSGGKLLELARANNLPFVEVPVGLQPRDSVLYMLKGLLTLVQKRDILDELAAVNLAEIEANSNLQSSEIANALADTIAIVYTSRENAVLGYIWKILLNETAKMPAFCNCFPELTHNEMQGLVNQSAVRILLVEDVADNEGVKNEMEVFGHVSLNNGLKVSEYSLAGSRVSKLLQTLVTARDVAHKIAMIKGVEADEVPFI